ncbi:MAG: flavodoxin [Actinomycetota bacterium]
MTTLLVVHHSPGISLAAMLDAALGGARSDGLEAVDVVAVEALAVTAEQVVAADGYLLVTPANLGYMSGALKHAFDTTYAAALGITAGRAYGLLVHGESDTTGAVLGIEKITTGLDWRLATAPVSVLGPVDADGLAACREAGAVVAATVLGF